MRGKVGVWLSGRVSAESGKPLAGAVITITSDELGMQASEVPVWAITNSLGEWRTRLLPNTYVMAIAARGFLPEIRAEIIVGNEEPRALNIVLRAGGSLVRGTVTDAGGGPISGARITARAEPSTGVTTISNTDGVYELTLAQGIFPVTVSHEDYVEQQSTVILGESHVDKNFVLVPGAVVRGRVVAADTDLPIADAHVHGRSTRPDGDWAGVTTSDDHGEFTLRGVGSGRIELRATAIGYASTQGKVVTVDVAERVETHVVVNRAFTIHGRVVLKGNPTVALRDVAVRASPVYSEPAPRTLAPTDAQGRFAIVGVRPGFYELVTSGAPAINLGYYEGQGIEVVDCDLEGAVIELDPGVCVSGRLNPPTRGRVRIVPQYPSYSWREEEVETDDTGRFVIEHVRSVVCTVVARTDDGRVGSTDTDLTTKTKVDDLVIRLETLATLTGSVVDARGCGVGNVDVSIGREGAIDPRDPRTISSSAGTFQLDGVPAGKLSLIAGAVAESEDDIRGARSRPFDISGAHMTGVTITVQRGNQLLRGVVVRDGQPVAYARVTARREDEHTTKQATTAADGTFQIGPLLDGTYSLVARDPRDTARAEATNVQPDNWTTLELTANATLSGRVTSAGIGLRIFDVSCWRRGLPEHVGEHIETSDGTFTIEQIPVGDYHCNVFSLVGRAGKRVTITHPTTRLELELELFASVSGTLVDVFTGVPVPGMYVFEPSDQDLFRAGRLLPSDAQGAFTVHSLVPGTVQLKVSPSREWWDEFARIPTSVSLVPGQRLDLGRVEVVTPFRHVRGELGFVGQVTNATFVTTEVIIGGAAERAGLRAGDAIATVDRRPMVKMYPHLVDLVVAGQTYVLGTSRGPIRVLATRRPDCNS